MVRFLKYLLAFFFGLVITAPVFAQRERDTYTTPSITSLEVSGQVRLAETGLPASRIPVRLERFGGGIVDQIDTDSGGRFRFPNLPRGYYKVIIKAPGYRQVQQDADLQVVVRAFMVFDLFSENPALTFVDVIDAKAPAEAREALFRGRTALAKKNRQEGILQLQKAITLYPRFYQAHLVLGSALIDARDWLRAEQILQQALEIKAESSVAMLALGEVFWRQKRYEEAEKTLLEGLKLDEKSWHGHFTLGRLYWELGQVAKAGPAIGRTLQLKPDFAEAHLLAGNILLRVEQRERALLEYKEYLRLEPNGEFAVQTRELVEKLNESILENKKSLN